MVDASVVGMRRCSNWTGIGQGRGERDAEPELGDDGAKIERAGWPTRTGKTLQRTKGIESGLK